MFETKSCFSFSYRDFFFVIWDCLRSFQIVFSVWIGMKSIMLEDIGSLGLFEIILKIGEKIFK